MKVFLKNQSSSLTASMLAAEGLTPKLSRQIQSYVFKNGKFPDSYPETSPALLSRLKEKMPIPHLSIVDKTVSSYDNFAKYLFESGDGVRFESVRIPVMTGKRHGYIVCVSSQAGCALGCTFCATGKLGFTRNLETWEIVDQALKVRADSDLPVKGIVFMGMGEPLLNTTNVLKAADLFSEPCGMAVSAKSITISTSGIISGLKEIIKARAPYRIIYSLSSADPAKRMSIMPVEKTNPLNEVIALLRERRAYAGGRTTLAWTLIKGFNTGKDEALLLKNIISGLDAQLDFIDVNDSSGKLLPPGDNERDGFINMLREHCRIPVVRRYSGGKDIEAACGMLAGRK